MYRDQVAYFLTAQNIEPDAANRLIQKIHQEKLFDGVLAPDYSDEDAKQKRIFFDCGNRGSTEAIDRDTVDMIMHELAMSFPNTRFFLLAENLDTPTDQYQVCTCGDMYQASELQTYMPALSAPVRFDQRENPPVPARDFLGEFLNNTDFDLLYKQKLALVKSLDEASYPLSWQQQAGPSAEVLEGLINFLDFIGDWAEHEGFFDYPMLDEKEKPALDSIIASAESRAGSLSSGQQKQQENEIG